MRVVTDWRIDLIRAHPDLFHPARRAPETACGGYPKCGDGWCELLNSACARIGAALEKSDTLNVVYIGEKLSKLHFCWRGNLSAEAEAKIADAVARAEARAQVTCEECGEEGRLYCSAGVPLTRCVVHARGQPVQVTLGREENVHIVRRVVAGKLRGICCRRYNRETDTFVDVPPYAHWVDLHGEILPSSFEGYEYG